MPSADSFLKARRFVARQPRWLKVSAILFFVYCILGFLVLPWILHRQLEKRLTTALHRHVAIAKLRMNPIALSVTIDGLRIDDPDGSRFLSWERLYFRANLWPILARQLTLNTLYLLRFHAHASMRRDGKLNFEDLLTSSGNPEPPSNTAEKKSWFTYGVDHLSVVEADAEFSDFSHPHPFRTTVGPFTFHLEHLRTRADANSPYDLTGTTESGERFSWSGTVHTEPFRSEGMIAFENLRIAKYAPYYEQQLALDVQSGLISLRTRYELEWGPARQHFRISQGELALRTLAIALRGHQQPAFQLAEMDIAGISIAPLEGTAEIDSVKLRGAVVRARREHDGQIDLTRLVPPSAPTASATSSKTATKASSKTPFRWAVRHVELSNGRIELEDAAPDPPVRVVLTPIEAFVEKLASAPQTTSTFQLSSGLNQSGRLNLSGTAALLRPSGEVAIRVADLDLSGFSPYLPLYGGLAARLPEGRLSVEAHAQFDLAKEPLSWAVSGDIHVDGFSLVDSERTKKLLSWKELRIAKLSTAAQPPGTSVESVRWIEPRFAIEVAEDRSSNLKRIMRKGASADSAPAPKAPTATSETTRTRARPPPYPVSIGTFQIIRGVAGFADRSIRPTSSLAMNSMDVRVHNFSMDVGARSSFSLNALIGKAPFKIAGTLSPRMINNATDLKIDSKGIDLTPLGPYVGKYLGYRLEKGTLDLDLRYKVAQRKLDANNLARLDEFTLGDSTNSPDATSLPIKLALAVMQDRDGVIELDVPVTGNLDDPNFRVGRVVWKQIVGIVTKVATAPFTLLAKLFGGGGSQKLDVVDFEPGSSALTPKTEKTLQALAKALYSRPALRLDVEGSADEKADGRALRVAELHRRGQEAKWKASKNHSGASSPDKVELLEDEYAKFIESAYRDLPRGVGGAGGSGGQKPTMTEMENQVLATIDLPPEATRKLAQERAEAARARIVQAAQFEPARLSLVQGGERAKKEGGGHVYFTLK